MDGLIGFFEQLGPNLQILGARMPLILDGVKVTVLASALGGLLALLISFVFGIAQTVKLAVVRILARIFVEFFRGTSLVVQLFWLAFVLPQLPYPFGFRLEPLVIGVLALGLNYGAYGAEVVRGSIGSVPKGQYEALSALSLSPVRGRFRAGLGADDPVPVESLDPAAQGQRDRQHGAAVRPLLPGGAGP